MRITFVVQRYGEDVAGGAEALCRDTARALVAAGDEVVVHTTTARDYLTWAAHYGVGVSDDDGVLVHRHAVDPPDPAVAARLVRSLSLDPGDAESERVWAMAQGPVAPALLSAVRRTAASRDAVALWTYLYATTQMAMPLCAGRAILVPLAHDEPMLRFTLTRGLMRMAAAFAFMTPEEALLVADLHGVGNRPACVVGAGLRPAVALPPVSGTAGAPGLPTRFALYLGRVDAAKGLDELIAFHAAYRAAGGELGLVLAGRAAGRLPVPDWVVRTGFVDDDHRAALLRTATAVVLPSRHESLSLVALEAWQLGTPTLANARSEVLAGQTTRSGAGLLYHDAATYRRGLAAIQGDARLGERLRAAGPAFTAPLTWDACVARWRWLVTRVAAGPATHRHGPGPNG